MDMNVTQLKQVSVMRALAADGTARAQREAAGVSLREAARALGTAPSTLSRWERGECKPRPDQALRWDDLLSELTGEPV